MSKEKFADMLEILGVIDQERQEFRYFTQEYFSAGLESVSLEDLENDYFEYKEIVK